MSSADFLLVKPLKLDGAVSFSRASPKWVFDHTGTLVEVPPDTLAITYDPADLSKAPYALVEQEATNYIRNNTMQGAVALPNNWSASIGSTTGLTIEPFTKVTIDGVECADIRIRGTPSRTNSISILFDNAGVAPATAGQAWAVSAFLAIAAGSDSGLNRIRFGVAEYNSTGVWITETGGASLILTNQLSREQFAATVARSDAASVRGTILFSFTVDVPFDITIRIGLPQLERDKVTSSIKTSNGIVTRAADVVGPGAGLVYSNVPITEPLWVAGTYALGAKVRNEANFVFESLVAGNTAALTDKTKWLPLGITNRLKMFDKAVKSQTTAPGSLTVVVRPAQVANNLTLLNVSGAQVTITQSDSGYTRSRAMVTHNVLSWYEFFYQDPQWTGDVVFGDVPPYVDSLITIHIKSPGNEAGLGGLFLGKAKFIGKTQWGLKAGILSYSGEEEDGFGNVTLQPRPSAKKMNFEVSIPRGYEDEAYRFLSAADNVEMVAIASTNWSMTMSYGYLGQWEVPLGIEGEKMPVEWRGLT